VENIAKLQDYICEYFEKELSQFYSLSVWKDVLVALRQAPKNEAAFKVFDRFGDAFKVRQMFVDVQASNDAWAPTLSIEYDWKIKESKIGVRIIVVKDKVLYAQLLDMYSVVKIFDEEYDYVKEFEKTVVLMKALRG
jgi:hypothetical protein